MKRHLGRRLSFLAGGASLILLGITFSGGGSPLMAAQHAKATGAQAAPKEEAAFPHMDQALAYLRAAHRQIDQSEPWFGDHREKAASHMDAAISNIQQGISYYLSKHPSTVRNEINPDTISVPAGHHFPSAIQLVQQAEGELSKGDDVYGGKRDAALAESKTAVAEMQQGMDYYKAHPHN